jgi:citrate synthase
MAEVKAGLQDVVVGTSEIHSIDGAKGILTYPAYVIHDLAAHSSFEELVNLLWNGRLPKPTELAELEKQLADNRPISPEMVDLLKRLPPPQHPMETLRTAVSALSLYDPEAEDMSAACSRRRRR